MFAFHDMCLYSTIFYLTISDVCSAVYKMRIYNQNQFTHMCDMRKTVTFMVFVILYVSIDSHSSSILTFSVFILCILPPRRNSCSWSKHVGSLSILSIFNIHFYLLLIRLLLYIVD